MNSEEKQKKIWRFRQIHLTFADVTIRKAIMKATRIVLVIVIMLLLVLHLLSVQEDRGYERRGQVLIDKVEAFRQAEKRLPENVEELGLEEETNQGPYYEKMDSASYVVFFNIGFDDTKIYYSDKKEWKDEP